MSGMRKLLAIVMACLLLSAWPAWGIAGEAAPVSVAKIVVYKAKRELITYDASGKEIHTYKVALGFTPEGAKHFEGDGKTPEGIYRIDGKNPNSQYHKNLGISYPNAADKAYAARRKKRPGGDIKIHGLGERFAYLGAAHRQHDWTWGCIALTNDEIDALYAATPIGTPIEIKP